MLPTQEAIDSLADRIERAFSLRRTPWYRGCSSPRVWAASAMTLWQVHHDFPEIPLDPELFVASQPISSTFIDPWCGLAQPEAGQRYRQRVRQIIRQLRAELRREIRRAEKLVASGQSLGRVLGASDSRLSPLGRFITAQRAGRSDLAERFQAGALTQHRSCPLYRKASLAFIPAELYPVGEAAEKQQTEVLPEIPQRIALLN